MNPKRNLISAAVVLAIAAAASPAYAVLERMGPIDNSPTIGGYPAWFQDHSGVTFEFCNLKTQAELDAGWCVMLPGNTTFPENFPTTYFNEHFYYDATNKLLDPGNNFKGTLIVALEAAFVNNNVVVGDQMTFSRLRVQIPNLPFEGDYRVITPYSDVTYQDKKAGDKIFETLDIGLGCPGTFDCTLNGTVGPFLLPSAVAGGSEVPPMPDLVTAPPGTDPFWDQLVAAGGVTADPRTGAKYVADPGRTGTVTGSPLPDFVANDTDGSTSSRNHNTFRVEVRAPSPTHDGPVFYTVDGEAQFTVAGRLMTGPLAGNITAPRATYKGDSAGNVTDVDVYTKAAATVQARIPAQPVPAAVVPVINFYDQACGGALTTDPVTGVTTVNPGPYTAPAGLTPHNLAATGNDFWGQSSPGGLPASHVCIEDTTSRNAAGQIVPTYTLVPLTDQVTITTAHYVGPENGTLSVNAVSSDPTAVLTLAGYGPAAAGTPGVAIGKGAATGLELAGGAAQVLAMAAPPSKVQIVSSKGGTQLRETDTAHGAAVLLGIPSAVNDSLLVNEDCSAVASLGCPAGAGTAVDLLANDTVMLDGVMRSLRDVVTANLATVTVTANAPRLGAATVTADGILTYTPNPNANGTDNVNYTVTVDGNVSNPAVVSVTITPVNDIPVAGNQAAGAVNLRTNTLNLLTGATDPDGANDIKNAVITSWPAQLGPQPVPANGVISYTPNTTGSYTVSYQVRDAAGVVSSNTGAATVAVLAAENIAYTKQDYKVGKQGGATSARWTVSGTDTVREGQTLTIVYGDGKLKSTGQICNGTAAIPACVIGSAVVDGTGVWLFDLVTSPGGTLDPTDANTWSTLPRNIRTFSSSPVLGGSQPAGIVLR
jgi:hypothetical protein